MKSPLESWTINFFIEKTKIMSPLSAWRLWRFSRRSLKGRRPARSTICLQLRNVIDGTVWLRNYGSDLATFKEVVVERIYECVADELPNCRSIVDLGANIGLASCYFLTQFPDAHVLAVEPDHENFELLQKNVSHQRNATRCSAIHRAVWSCEKELNVERWRGDDRFSSVRVTGEGIGDEVVQGSSLKQIIAESSFPRIDLLKVDIEGAEVELLANAEDWLPLVDAIAIEFHNETRAQSGFDRKMQDSGFHIIRDDAHTVLARRVNATP